MIDPVYEYRTEDVKLSQVRKGDFFPKSDPHGDHKVDTVKSGTKWTEARDVNGKLVARDENGAVYMISRRFETEDSKAARRRELHNESIQKDLERWSLSTPEALAQVSESIEKYGFAQDYLIEGLVKAQVSDKVKSEWAEFHRSHVGFEADSVDALRKFIEKKQRDLLRFARGTSRSTSVMSNVMEDAEAAAIAKFIEHAGWR